MEEKNKESIEEPLAKGGASFAVAGIPKAQPRPKVTSHGTYTPDTADAWKGKVMAAFRACRRPQAEGPVRLEVSFFLPAPKSMKQEGIPVPHAKKPDLDNLLKAVMDALTAAGAWKDDAQVRSVKASKSYAFGFAAGADILILEEGQ